MSHESGTHRRRFRTIGGVGVAGKAAVVAGLGLVDLESGKARNRRASDVTASDRPRVGSVTVEIEDALVDGLQIEAAVVREQALFPRAPRAIGPRHRLGPPVGSIRGPVWDTSK